MKYKVTITEEVWQSIEIEADSEEQAEELAWDIYCKSGFAEFDIDGSETIDEAHVEEL